MRELATQSANGTLQNTDRDNIAVEFKSLQSEINRLAGSASFNGNNLVNGATSQFKLQIGAGTTEQLNVSIIGSSTGDYVALTTSAMGGATVISDITVSSATQAIAALTSIDSALTNVATARASFGAMSNRLENVVTGLQTKQTNYAAANSRIRDVDVASETANLARLQVLQQAGSSILSQANQGPQAALSLLR
jgi:flagellin